MAFGHALKQTSELLWYRPYSWQRILANQATYEMGSTWVPTLPTYLQIEATNHCDQRCPFCATGNGTLSRPQGMMSFDFFKQIMDDFGKHANHIDLYMQGESFLNKSISARRGQPGDPWGLPSAGEVRESVEQHSRHGRGAEAEERLPDPHQDGNDHHEAQRR